MTQASSIKSAEGKLGILLVGLGAVSTTTIAGIMAVRKGIAKPIGSLTEMGTIRLGKRTENRTPKIREFVPLAGYDQLVFGGWDIFEDNCYEAAKTAGVLEASLLLQQALDTLRMPSYPKTSGSKGVHVYVPIKRGPTQKDVWTFTKALAMTLAERHPDIMTAQYRVAKRPKGRVLVDYNQNAWGRTLASVYSVRPTRVASVSTPVTWAEIERGITSEQFTMDVVLKRIARHGYLFAPSLTGQVKLPM